MALLKPSAKPNKVQARIYIDSNTINKAKEYCNFAGIKKLDEFFEQAAEFVMNKDRDWKKHQITNVE